MSNDTTIPVRRVPRLFARQTSVTRLYDWVLARCYDVFMDVCAFGYRKTVMTFYRRYLPARRGVSRVLEVGPGTGYVTQVVATTLDAELTCFDISAIMLRQLRKRLDRARVPRWPRLVQGDITKRSELAADTYDLVIAQSMIEHLPDISPALAEFHRVLAPGGTLLVSDICDGVLGRLFALVCQVRSFSKPEISAALRAAGFEQLEFLDYEPTSFTMRNTLFFAQAKKPVAGATA